MPIVFLSPSTQDWNPYVTGSGSEEYWMNRIVDAMEPYLRSNGIRYRRNDPDTSAGAAIREANSGYYDFYLALHSNAIGNGSAQTSARGIIAFYYPGSAGGQRGAELIAKNLREIYPLPDKVTTRPTTALGEVSRSRFPAVLVEIGYHDNYSDALWLESPCGGCGPAACQGADGVFRPALHPAYGPETGNGPPELRHTESPRRAVLRRYGNRQPAKRRGGDGLRRVAGMVCGAIRRSGGIRRRSLYRRIGRKADRLRGKS